VVKSFEWWFCRRCCCDLWVESIINNVYADLVRRELRPQRAHLYSTFCPIYTYLKIHKEDTRTKEGTILVVRSSWRRTNGCDIPVPGTIAFLIHLESILSSQSHEPSK
jgi:hypothetical protein